MEKVCEALPEAAIKKKRFPEKRDCKGEWSASKKFGTLSGNRVTLNMRWVAEETTGFY